MRASRLNAIPMRAGNLAARYQVDEPDTPILFLLGRRDFGTDVDSPKQGSE